MTATLLLLHLWVSRLRRHHHARWVRKGSTVCDSVTQSTRVFFPCQVAVLQGTTGLEGMHRADLGADPQAPALSLEAPERHSGVSQPRAKIQPRTCQPAVRLFGTCVPTGGEVS